MKRIASTMGLIGCLVGGCGGGIEMEEGGADGGMIPDPNSPDAGDVTPINGPCTATHGAGKQGVVMVFHDAEGAPLAMVETDATGSATYEACVPGGMVTAAQDTHLFTVQGVNPGDSVVIDREFKAPTAVPQMLAQIASPLDLTTNSSKYEGRYGNCLVKSFANSGGGFLTVANPTPCVGEDPSNISIVNFGLSDSGYINGFSRGDAMPNANPVLAGSPWVQYPGASLIALSNVPAGLIEGMVESAPAIDGVIFSSVSDKKPDGKFLASDDTADLDIWPSSVFDENRVQVSATWGQTSYSTTGFRAAEVGLNFDIGDLLLKGVASAGLDTSDAQRPAYQWTAGDPRATLARAEIVWNDGQTDGIWIVVGPGNSGELRAPALPTQLSFLGPSPTATLSHDKLVHVDVEHSYAEVLAAGLSVFGTEFQIVPKGQTIKLSFWLNPQF